MSKRKNSCAPAPTDANRKDPLGYPPVQLASARGQVQMVELLLASGADPLLLDTRMGASALHKAAIGGTDNPEIVEMLRSPGDGTEGEG